MESTTYKTTELQNIAIRDIIPILSVYYKGSLDEKMESYTRPTITTKNV